jgi:hypothetical protein
VWRNAQAEFIRGRGKPNNPLNFVRILEFSKPEWLPAGRNPRNPVAFEKQSLLLI